MARIRSIKPEFWTDGKVVGLPFEARLLFMGTWNFARCDQGHLDDDPVALKLKVLPADNVDAHATLEVLVAAGLLDRYEADGRTFLHIRRFTEHQKIETRWNSRCPYCPLQDSSNLSEPRPNSSQEGKGGEGSRKGKKKTPLPPAEDNGFEDFWNTYPKQPNGKKPEKRKAQAQWQKLTGDERDLALTGVVHYRADCDRGTYAKHAFRWLREKLWEEWQEPAVPVLKPGEHRSPSSFTGWGQPSGEREPRCEHSDPMCRDCRRANVIRLREMAEGIGAMSS